MIGTVSTGAARFTLSAVSALLAAALSAGLAGQARAASIADFQTVVDSYLEDRREAEMITGVSAYVSLGDPGPAIELFAGDTSERGGVPVSGDTLFQIGSNTKAFTGALILALEAEGKLDIDDTVGDWLPLYPEWKNVTIRRLLNMTSGLPTYSESLPLSRLWVTDPDRHYTMEDLIDYAYPSDTVDLPPNEGYFYSNTNYVLAGMIAEKASGMSYKDAVEEKLFKPAGLTDMHYEPVAYPDAVLDRTASGYFNNPECGLYEPDCAEAVLAPMIGRDVRTTDVSWAGPAGGIIGTPRQLARWIRVVFSGKVLPPEQLEEFLSFVSTRTGDPIDDVTAEDPRGFSLGLVRVFNPQVGKVWFYEGETLGYRMAFLFSPESDVLVSAATNSQPAGDEDHLVPMIAKLYDLARQARGE
ncbi:serine hydrolase domain-containing protein [Microbaculum marinum]|uniref:Serine hydrolase domain-containing protein n=1 Tax=Microbaculum marinum TaxID=1764581 RepID=A0AAW9RKI3_9HYPH